MDASPTYRSGEPFGVGRVIGEAFALYRAHAATLLWAAIAVFVVAGVLQALLADTDSFVLRLLGSVISLIASTLFTGFVVSLVADVRDGKRDFSSGELIRSSSDAIGRLIVNGFFYGLGVVVGLVLLIVPGLFLLTIWAVCAPAIVVERRGAFEAFGRSHELVRGYGWTVFGAILVAFLILIGVGLAALSIGAAIGGLGGAVAFGIVANILAAPFAALVASVLFFDLRAEKGGAAEAPGPEAPPNVPTPTP